MRSNGCGSESTKTTFSGSGVSMDETGPQMKDAPPPIFLVRSIEPFTACEVSRLPSWNFTPSRRVKVQVLPSALTAQDVASRGSILASAVSVAGM
ncbi:hypothetical protein D9M70_551930 [compost metagenome]